MHIAGAWRTRTAWTVAVLVAIAICAGWSFDSTLAGETPKIAAAATSDYQIGAALQAVNRAQGLRIGFTHSGVRIQPGSDEGPWSVELTLGSYGPLDAASPINGGPPKVDGARVEHRYGSGITGWYANSEDGLVQGFTIDGPAGPPNPENLNFHEIDISVATEGVEIRTIADGSVIFVTSGGRETLRWTLAGGTDARGTAVRVKMAVIDPTDGSAPWLQLVPVVEPWAQYPVHVQMRLDTRELKSEEGAETDPLAALAPPPEDTCAGAQVIPAGPYPVLSTTVNNSLATDAGDPTNTCQANSHLGLWYTFTPTANDNYIVKTCNPPTATTRSDTVLAVYTSAAGCAGPFTQVACDDDACDPGLQSLIGSVAMTAGTTYYILAYSYSTTGGDIQIEISRPLPPPAEDTCAGAQVIPGGGPWPALTTVVDNSWATSTNDPAATCSTSEALGLWYTFTPAVDGPYYITTCQNMAPGSARQDTVLDIFTSAGGCAGPFTEVATGCNDNNAECEGHTLQSLIQPTLTAGTTYYILAYNTGTTTKGNVQLYVEPSPAAPPNDLCPGAQVIPGAGPWPYLTAPVDITNATVAGGDPTVWSCLSTVNHVAWYEFIPVTSGTYNFTTCRNAAPGTTCLDTVLSVYTSSTGACGGTYTQVSGACNDNDATCTGATNLSRMSVTMTAGQQYYVLVGSPGTTVPQPGFVQIEVTFTAPPFNDSCLTPIPIVPSIPLAGTTAGAFNDYQLSATAPTCFTLPTPPAPIGQTASAAPGREVVYEFVPPLTGNYSCRAYSYSTSQNLVVYVSEVCPIPTPGTPVTITNPPCVGASNRSTTSWQEEVMCLPLNGGQPYYVFVDDNSSGNAGSPFYVKCTPCVREVETNNTPATANQFVCGIEGSISPAGDVDFFLLTGATTNSRVFMLADGGATSATDFDMRITTATDTLQYDDASADTPYGGLSTSIDGTTLVNGPPYYIRMSYYSASTQSEPYRLYGVIEPPRGTEIPETEPNDTAAQANANPLNYFSGTMVALADADWYTFTANAGDVIFVGLDTDPNYDGVANNLALTLYDASGVAILVAVNGSASTTPTIGRPPTLGSLTATLPIAAGEELEWNAAYTGTYFVKVTTTSGFGQEYALAIAKNCQTDSTDFGVTKSALPDPVATGQLLTYTVVVTNNGPGAGGATMQDLLPAGTTFVSVTAASWTCTAPPVGGTGTVSCSGGLANGGTETITIVVQVGWCLGPGFQIVNTATVTAGGTDPNQTNDSFITATTVTDNGLCSDNDACTLGDVCQGNTCVPGPLRDCNDNDVCTVDSCDPTTGNCVYASFVCDDGNPCTDDVCIGPTQGCIFTPDDTNACTDNDLCTSDACVNGQCVSTTTVFCNDGDQCTVDTCDPTTGLCVYTPSVGLACSDGNTCTGNDVCGCAPGQNINEGFDAETPPALPTGWSTQLIVGLAADKAWETTASFFDIAPNSVYTDDPNHVTDKVLVSPPFSALGGTQLTFMNRYDLENNTTTPGNAYDGGVLEIKIGAGPWTDIIAAGGVWVSGGYTHTIVAATNPLNGRPCWSGASAGFVATSVTLPAVVTGQTVQLRWRVATDSSVAKTGQWIDTIAIPVCNILCAGTPQGDGSPCDDGDVCTTPDTCTGGVCSGPAIAPPLEVNNSVRLAGGGGGGGAIATISWTDPPAPYNVYRGLKSGTWTYNHTCFDPNTPGPSVDATVPGSGTLYYYLVSRRDNVCNLESVLGRDSAGTPDPNPTPCP